MAAGHNNPPPHQRFQGASFPECSLLQKRSTYLAQLAMYITDKSQLWSQVGHFKI